MGVNMTAREKLIEVMKERKWYGDVIAPSTARSLKFNILNGGSVTDQKIEETLRLLGYEPKSEKYELKKVLVW